MPAIPGGRQVSPARRRGAAPARRQARSVRAAFDLLEPRLMLCAGDDDSALLPAIGHSPAIAGDLLAPPPDAGRFDNPLPAGSLAGPGAPIPRANHPLADLPQLNSKPGALAKLYLDFDGDVTASWGSYAPGTTPAYDQDGNAAQFSDGELTTINNVWARVAEIYSPFNVNVTTVDPGNLNNLETLKAVVGGAGAWAGGQYGGIAFVGSFTNSASNKVFVFPANLANGDAKFTAIAIGHEAGHGFGLEHQSTYNGTTKVDEYNPGDASKAPIMGLAYDAVRGLWWNGPNSISSSTIQDDLSVISNATNGFGYRADDHGNAVGSATPLAIVGTAASAAGIIERTSDLDVFSFTTGTGNVTLTASVAASGPMLDLKLQLLDAVGTVILTRDTATLSETFTTSLAGGSYRLLVGSHGSYGDIGQYTVSGTIPAFVSLVPGVPDLVAGSDTGFSATDDVTLLDNGVAGKTLQFSVAGTINGATVFIYADGTLVGSAAAAGATTLVATNGTADLADGTHAITARQTEVGLPQSSASAALTITVDTVAPAAPPAPDLQAASDTGASSSDNVTSDLTPTFNLVASPYFRFFRDGGQIGADYESGAAYTAPAQATGTFSFAARTVDAAGNVSALGAALAVTFLPGVAIADLSANEGDVGSSNAAFTVTLSAASTQQVTVAFATAGGSAAAGVDYTSTSGTLTFNAGVVSRTINVPILGDPLDETNETFTIDLSAPTNAIVDDGKATGTIVDNDATPTLATADLSLVEGTGGAKNATLNVVLSQASGLQVTVVYATAAGSAAAGLDYTTVSGTLTFAPGTTSQSVVVPITTDADVEPDETFTLNLVGAVNATIADGQATVTIANDDSVSIAIADASVVERDAGLLNAIFAVTLSGSHYLTVKVVYATANGGATAAVDYAARSGTLTFNPGDTSQTILVPTLGDTRDEADETFFVNLSAPENATLADSQAIGTIVDNDAPPAAAIDDVTVTEGNSGTQNATFTVTLDAASGKTIAVQYRTLAGSATAPDDFVATSGTLTFTPSVIARTIAVPIVGDLLDESDETFTVELLNPTNVTLANAQATGTILDDDTTLSLVVTNTNDSGAGSLRQAVLNANATPGVPDTIVFQIPGAGPHAIGLVAPLPALVDAATAQVAAGEVQVGTFSAHPFAKFASLTKTGAGTLVLAGNQSYDPGAQLVVGGGAVRLASDAGANLVVGVATNLDIAATQHLGGLVIGTAGEVDVLPNGGTLLVTPSLAIAAGGRLDLADNDLVVQATAGTRAAVVASVNGWIESGFNAFAWTGAGIASSVAAGDATHLTALGVMLDDDGLGGAYRASFDGQAVDANSVLVKYTYYGDADLSGSVDGTDYALVDNGFNSALAGWFNGDVDYSGSVDGTDYALVDNAFNGQSGPLAAGGPAVPIDPVGPIPRSHGGAGAIDAALADAASSIADAYLDDAAIDLIAASGPFGGKRRR